MTVADGTAFVTALEDAAQQGTGCLYVSDAHATRSGRVFFDDTKVYAVHVDGFMPKVGYRLRTGGMLTTEQYDTLLAQVGDDPYAPNFGGLAVDAGFITLDVLNAVLREILLSSVGAMFDWIDPVTKFKRNASTDQFVIPPVKVASILKAVDKRRDRWAELWSQIAAGLSPEDAYPVATGGFGPEEEVSSEVAAVLAAADGTRSLDAVAGECGLTRFETGHVLGHLVGNHIVTINALRTGPDEHAAPTGGTAEAATTEAVVGPESGGEVIESDSPATEESEERTDFAAVHTTPEAVPHFAPDVIETVGVAEDIPEDGEPSAFGVAEGALPDGTDRGTIPTEQIEHDPEDVPATATVPPLNGLPDPEPTASVASVEFAAPPVEPSEDPGQAVQPAPVPVTPADVPVFVDGSALNAPHAATAVADGMPGVPLPPLPEFLPVAPVPASASGPVHEEATDDPETGSEVGQPQEPVAVSAQEPAAAPVAEPEEPAHEEPVPVEEAASVAPIADDRATLARQRLEEEISVADEVLSAARSALERATTEFDSHAVAATQMQDTLHRYEQFLDTAVNDQARLSQDAVTLTSDREEILAQAEVALAHAETASGEARVATEEVESARDALAKAQEALTAAEHRLQAAQQAEEDANATAVVAARTVEELDARIEAITADLADAEERVVSHTEEIKDVRQMSDAVAQAQEHAAVLRDEAQQRLETAERNLAAKHERLTQLG